MRTARDDGSVERMKGRMMEGWEDGRRERMEQTERDTESKQQQLCSNPTIWTATAVGLWR